MLTHQQFFLTYQHLFRSERSVSEEKGQVPLQTSVEFMRAYNAQAHEIINAITAVVIDAEAGLNWLRAQPQDLEEVRRTLDAIASDGKRAAEMVVRLRALAKKALTADGAPAPLS
jgi:hypothetical protein